MGHRLYCQLPFSLKGVLGKKREFVEYAETDETGLVKTDRGDYTNAPFDITGRLYFSESTIRTRIILRISTATLAQGSPRRRTGRSSIRPLSICLCRKRSLRRSSKSGAICTAGRASSSGIFSIRDLNF
jgi:hypothetical protein